MYKTASRNMQHAAISETTLKLVGGTQDLTTEEQYESAKEAYCRLIDINKNETCKAKKKIYGKQLQDMTHIMGELREKVKKEKPPQQVTDYIVKIFKSRLTKEEWLEVVAEARRMALAN